MGISLKVIARQEFELTSNDVAVPHVSHGDPHQVFLKQNIYLGKGKIYFFNHNIFLYILW